MKNFHETIYVDRFYSCYQCSIQHALKKAAPRSWANKRKILGLTF